MEGVAGLLQSGRLRAGAGANADGDESILSKLRILAQTLKNLGGYVVPGRLVAVVALMGVGVVAAFGLVPGTLVPDAPTQLVRRDLASPALTALARDEGYWREESIQRGDTIGKARMSGQRHVHVVVSMDCIGAMDSGRLFGARKPAAKKQIIARNVCSVSAGSHNPFGLGAVEV